MSSLTKHIDEGGPDWDWAEIALTPLIEEVRTRGIDITPGRKITHDQGVSFSGFWSQGDGVAFDASINWSVFLEENPRLKLELPEWYLVLSANPDFICGGVRRNNGRSNLLTVDLDINGDTLIENGFFAGMDYESIPQLNFSELERVVAVICKGEAQQMYQSLENTYEGLCDECRAQRIEDILEVEREQLEKCLARLLFLGAVFTYEQECDAMDFGDNWIDAYDLNVLGLVGISRQEGVYKGRNITEKGREMLCLNTKTTGADTI